MAGIKHGHHEEQVRILSEVALALRLHGHLLFINQMAIDPRAFSFREDFCGQPQRVSIRRAVGRHVVAFHEGRQRNFSLEFHRAFGSLRRLEGNIARSPAEGLRTASQRREVLLDE